MGHGISGVVSGLICEMGKEMDGHSDFGSEPSVHWSIHNTIAFDIMFSFRHSADVAYTPKTLTCLHRRSEGCPGDIDKPTHRFRDARWTQLLEPYGGRNRGYILTMCSCRHEYIRHGSRSCRRPKQGLGRRRAHNILKWIHRRHPRPHRLCPRRIHRLWSRRRRP